LYSSRRFRFFASFDFGINRLIPFSQISRNGSVKMCDFGISGYLVDSVAKTIDAGCKPYMAVTHFSIRTIGCPFLSPVVDLIKTLGS
jgi:hypothetical protein